MKRLIVEFPDRHINIPADRMELDKESCMVLAYNGDCIVSIFDYTKIVEAHFSETGGEKP